MKRQELRIRSTQLRKEANEKHICVNCGNSLPSGKRVYCSEDCSIKFFKKFDYSATSEILKEYAKTLKEEYKATHPKIEREPWTQPVAKKEYKCEFCFTTIKKGEQYENYIRLPEYDEWFDDAPYETLRYHKNCQQFINLLVKIDLLNDEGFDEDEISDVLALISIETGKDYGTFINDIITGIFPSEDELKNIVKEYDFYEYEIHGESDHVSYRYVYSVRYEAFNHTSLAIHNSRSEIKESENFFSNYYKEWNGNKFNRILSVKETKIPLSSLGNRGIK